MPYIYSDPEREKEENALPDIEIFEAHRNDEDGRLLCNLFDGPGWYWWPCLPGCLPDTDYPNGPFETFQEAVADAQDI